MLRPPNSKFLKILLNYLFSRGSKWNLNRSELFFHPKQGKGNQFGIFLSKVTARYDNSLSEDILKPLKSSHKIKSMALQNKVIKSTPLSFLSSYSNISGDKKLTVIEEFKPNLSRSYKMGLKFQILKVTHLPSHFNEMLIKEKQI